MKSQESEIALIYNSNKQKDKEVLGYAQSLESHKLNERDITSSKLTEKQLAELATEMKVEVKDMVDQNEEKYMKEVEGGDFSSEELLKLMVNNPELVKTPIAKMNGKTFIVKSQYSLVNEDLEVGGVKSPQGNESEKQN